MAVLARGLAATGSSCTGWTAIVRVLDRSNGRLRWRCRVGSPIESSPVVRDGHRLLRRLERPRLRARPADGAASAGRSARATRSRRAAAVAGGDALHRRLRRTAAGARAARPGASAGRVASTAASTGRPPSRRGRVFVPSLDRRLADRLLDRRPLPLAPLDTGAYVYSSPAVVERPRLLRLLQRRPLLRLGARPGASLWAVGAGRPDLRRRRRRRRRRLRRLDFARRIVGVDARSGRVLLRFPHGEYVAVSGNGGTLLLHGYSRALRACEPTVRKWLLIGGARRSCSRSPPASAAPTSSQAASRRPTSAARRRSSS